MKKSLLTTSAAILFVVGTGFSSVTYASGGPLSEPWKTFCYIGSTQHKGQPSSQVVPGMGTLTPALGTLTPPNIPMIPLEK